jgi:hypothetical protein
MLATPTAVLPVPVPSIAATTTAPSSPARPGNSVEAEARSVSGALCLLVRLVATVHVRL